MRRCNPCRHCNGTAKQFDKVTPCQQCLGRPGRARRDAFLFLRFPDKYGNEVIACAGCGLFMRYTRWCKPCTQKRARKWGWGDLPGGIPKRRAPVPCSCYKCESCNGTGLHWRNNCSDCLGTGMYSKGKDGKPHPRATIATRPDLLPDDYTVPAAVASNIPWEQETKSKTGY